MSWWPEGSPKGLNVCDGGEKWVRQGCSSLFLEGGSVILTGVKSNRA